MVRGAWDAADGADGASQVPGEQPADGGPPDASTSDEVERDEQPVSPRRGLDSPALDSWERAGSGLRRRARSWRPARPAAVRGAGAEGPAGRAGMRCTGRAAVSRARRVAVATGVALGLSSTRRAALLALVVCALALSVAVPLRNYVTQRRELAAVQAEQERLRTEVDDLAARKRALSDPAWVQALARERLRFVLPGETPYMVQLPAPAPAPVTAAAPPMPEEPWYVRLAHDVLGTTR